jgi:hypothetical protein
MVGGYQLASSASVAERWSDGLRIDDFDCLMYVLVIDDLACVLAIDWKWLS